MLPKYGKGDKENEGEGGDKPNGGEGDSSRAHSLPHGHYDHQLHGQWTTTLRKSPKVERLSGIIIDTFDLTDPCLIARDDVHDLHDISGIYHAVAVHIAPCLVTAT